MQKLVVAGLAIAFALMSGAYGLALAGSWWWWHLATVALAVEHIAVLLYIFRIVMQGGLDGAAARVTAGTR